mgnify:CR=1 FL=1
MYNEVRYFMDEDMINMGKRIQNLRKQRGYKGMEFADMIGIGKRSAFQN